MPLGTLTAGVQTLAGVLLPSAGVFLLLLCNDKAVLGPWVNGAGRNAPVPDLDLVTVADAARRLASHPGPAPATWLGQESADALVFLSLADLRDDAVTLTPKAASSRRPTAGGSAGKSSPAVLHLHLHLRDLALGQVVSRISLEPSVSSVSRTVLTLTEPAIGAGP